MFKVGDRVIAVRPHSSDNFIGVEGTVVDTSTNTATVRFDIDIRGWHSDPHCWGFWPVDGKWAIEHIKVHANHISKRQGAVV